MKANLTWVMPLLWAGLLAAPPENQVLERKFTWVEPGDPSAIDIRRVGEATIQKAGSNLISEVNRVLSTKGAEAGIDELHLRQLQLPAGVPGQPRVTALKRTSLKVRYPANIPDNADLAALMTFQSALADGDTPPGVLMQKIEAAGSAPAEWRVYRPIILASNCLVCHGPEEGLDSGVKAKIQRLYPADKATNYAANEWRGFMRASLTAPAESSPAPKKTNP